MFRPSSCLILGLCVLLDTASAAAPDAEPGFLFSPPPRDHSDSSSREEVVSAEFPEQVEAEWNSGMASNTGGAPSNTGWVRVSRSCFEALKAAEVRFDPLQPWFSLQWRLNIVDNSPGSAVNQVQEGPQTLHQAWNMGAQGEWRTMEDPEYIRRVMEHDQNYGNGVGGVFGTLPTPNGAMPHGPARVIGPVLALDETRDGGGYYVVGVRVELAEFPEQVEAEWNSGSGLAPEDVASAKLLFGTCYASRYRIGMVADTQYADVPDTYPDDGTRRYRNALHLVERAVDERFTRSGRGKVHATIDVLINLGDIVDSQTGENFERDLGRVQAQFDRVGVPVFDLVGNHEVKCKPRSELCRHLRPLTEWQNNALYYTRTVGPGGRFRLLFLDAFVEAIMGYEDWAPPSEVFSPDSEDAPRYHPNAQAARRLIQGKNPNVILESGEIASRGWFKDIPLDSGRLQFVPYNGALGETQRDWLRDQLREAFSEKQYVVIFCHVPMHSSKSSRTLLWDSEEVKEILREAVGEGNPAKGQGAVSHGGEQEEKTATSSHSNIEASSLVSPSVSSPASEDSPASGDKQLPKLGDHVLAFVAGHKHKWIHTTDELGIEHVVLPSPMLAEPVEEGGECCSIMELGVSNQAGVEKAFANIVGFGHDSLNISRTVAFVDNNAPAQEAPLYSGEREDEIHPSP